MSRRQRGDSKAAILAAASGEFAAHGYSGARMDRIARRAAVNKQLLFYYFGSKAGLHQAVVDRLTDETRSAVCGTAIAPGHADARMRTAVGLAFDTLASRPYLVRLCTQRAQAGEASDTAGVALAELRDSFRRIVLEGQGLGFFRDDADPVFVAEQAVCSALGYLASEPAERQNDEARRAWRDKLADALIRSLAW